MDELTVQQILDARDAKLRQEWKLDIQYALQEQAVRFDAMMRNVEMALAAALSVSQSVSDKIDGVIMRDEQHHTAVLEQLSRQDKLLVEWRADIERWRHVQRVSVGVFQLLMMIPWAGLVQRLIAWIKAFFGWVFVVGGGVALGVVLFLSVWR